jgi:hypothetical protein
MTDTMTSQNIVLSSWDTLCKLIVQYKTDEDTYKIHYGSRKLLDVCKALRNLQEYIKHINWN